MSRQVFINLPIKDMARSQAFFKSLGFGFNPQFTNDQGACMIISKDHSYVMLLVESFFQGFTKKAIADATKTTEVLICLSCESREAVDEMVSKAVAAGGTAPNPKQDHGFMYSHGFTDLDSHVWEVVWMNPNAAPPNA